MPLRSLFQSGDIHSSSSHEYWLQMVHYSFTLEITLSLSKLTLPRPCTLLQSVCIQWLVHAVWKAWNYYFNLGQFWRANPFHRWAQGWLRPLCICITFQFSLSSVLPPSLPYRCCPNISSLVQLLNAKSCLRYCFWGRWPKSMGAKSDPKEWTVKWDIRTGLPAGWPALWLLLLVVGGVLISPGML